MEKAALKNYITSLLPVSPDKLDLVTSGFEWMELEKADLLLKENKVSRYAWFLESGVIRSFVYNNEGDEVTTNIFSAPVFVSDFLSFFKQQPTQENFQALTHCNIWKIGFDVMQHNFHTYPEFREFGRMMLVTNYSKLHDRMLGMIKDTAETRYLKLLHQQPDIFQHVPLKIIASYLGITDSSLSRIRKEISQR